MSVTALVSLERVSDEDFRWYKLGDDPPEKWFISVTEVLQVAVDKRLQSYMQRTSAAQQERTKETTTNIGSELHDLIEKDAYGQPNEDPPRDPLKAAFDQWLKLKTEHKIHADAVEFGVFSRKHGYAGTADMLGTCDGKRCLLDVKTGYLSVKSGWQLAGYKNAMLEMEGPQDLDIVAIQVKRDGSGAQIYNYSHYDWCLQCFLSCLQIWRGLYFYQLQKKGWCWLKT